MGKLRAIGFSAFFAMLWQRGTQYENDVMEDGGLEALDLSNVESGEKERLDRAVADAEQELRAKVAEIAGSPAEPVSV